MSRITNNSHDGSIGGDNGSNKNKNLLNTWFPTTLNPVIFSAPMYGTATGALAAEVSKAGGFGFIPAGYDYSPSSPQLSVMSQELDTARSILGLSGEELPVGVGFLLCHSSVSYLIETTIPVLNQHRPQAVWLFAPRDKDLASGLIKRIVEALRGEGYKVFFQVGTVASARQALGDGADVVVAQGADAGGHQFVGGAGLVGLVPEVLEMVETEFGEEKRRKEGRERVVVVAAGGVVEGRGMAGALALGAEGVAMGTRFIMAKEANTPECRRKLIAETVDGGPATFKHPVMDQIQATGIWPSVFDGRAIVNTAIQDFQNGVSLEENITLCKEARAVGDVSREFTWAGTGVGLVKDVQPAGDIVKEVREGAIARIKRLQNLL
ncbi:Nitronate monooxygenase [Podospora australis]|uniref:Nitronate monooxygenase n=1 Tax=Podospora australis TaxID=1536484 RepID=A0AAN7AJL9_9PEZI|nr:Nitronate monooxygenase [Podospora australis]